MESHDCSSKVPRLKISSDTYQWLKYGQKRISGSNHQRYYYRCAMHRENLCPAKRVIDFPVDRPTCQKVVQFGTHNHNPHCEKIYKSMRHQLKSENLSIETEIHKMLSEFGGTNRGGMTAGWQLHETGDSLSSHFTLGDILLASQDSSDQKYALRSGIPRSMLKLTAFKQNLDTLLDATEISLDGSRDCLISNSRLAASVKEIDVASYDCWRSILSISNNSDGSELSDMLNGTHFHEGTLPGNCDIGSNVATTVNQPHATVQPYMNDASGQNDDSSRLAPLPPNQPLTEYIITPVGTFHTGLKKGGS